MRIKTWNNDLYQICAVSLSTSWLSLLVLGDKLYYLSEVVLDGYERRMIMDDQVRSITSCLRTFQHLNSFGQSGAEEQNCHQHFLIFNLFLDQLCVKQVAVTFTGTIWCNDIVLYCKYHIYLDEMLEPLHIS